MDGRVLGIEWLVALLDPAALGSHPNFSDRDLSHAGRLADVVNPTPTFDFVAPGDGEDPISSVGQQIVVAAQRSMLAESQRSGVTEIRNLLSENLLNPGQVVALSLLGSVALVELDLYEESNQVLVSARDRLSAEFAMDGVDYAPGSVALLRAVLLQNLAVSCVRRGRRREALELVRDVHPTLPKRGDSYEPFVVSRGTSRTSAQIQRQLGANLRAAARSVESWLEPMSSRSWVKVVRSNPSDLVNRVAHAHAEAGRSLLAADLKRRMRWSSGGFTVSAGDPIDQPASHALLISQFGGDLASIRRSMMFLGQLRISRSDVDTEWASVEALRLFRQSGSSDSQADVIRMLRAGGPLSSLRTDAEQVLNRLLEDSLVTDEDVAALVAAAELLEPNDLAAAIELVSRYMDQASSGEWETNRAPFSMMEVGLKALARLVPGSGGDYLVASRLNTVLRAYPNELDFLEAAAMSVVTNVDWKSAGGEQATALLEWVNSGVGASAPRFVQVVLDRLRPGPPESEPVVELHDLDRAVMTISRAGAGGVVQPADIDFAAETVLGSLLQMQSMAHSGSFSVGRYRPADVAAAMALTTNTTRVWDALVQVLIDPAVARSDKEPAWARIAEAVAEGWFIPQDARDALLGASPTALAGSDVDLFGVEGRATPGSAVRGRLALEDVPSATTLLDVVHLAGSTRPADRLEAAKCCGVAIRRGEAIDVLVGIALQISQDSDPTVRSEAAFFLGSAAQLDHAFSSAFENRLLEALREDGLLVPLQALRGLQRADTATLSVRAEVETMAANHSVRAVRDSATSLLSDWSSASN